MPYTINKNLKTIKPHLSRFFKSGLVLPLLLVLGTFSANVLAQNGFIGSPDGGADNLGGPSQASENNDGSFIPGVALTSVVALAAVENLTAPYYDAPREDEDPGMLIIGDSALLNTGNPERGVLTSRDGILVYKIQKGDTLSKIAADFGISLNTIYWANKNIKSASLKVGAEISILPVSGVIHQVQTGENLQTIASLYEVSEARIAKVNAKVLSHGIEAGMNLIIPDAKPVKTAMALSSKLPDYPGYFAPPTTGWNWGKLHNYNAVDIADACGRPVYASAEGLVVESVSNDDWNAGYGNYLIIEHPNGTKTRYAHNKENLRSRGDYVVQGDPIATIGNTGNTHGPTGCHLHFEVVGARNPFAK